MLVIYMILLLSGTSPIFAQDRIGKNCRVFTIYKFRSMHQGVINQGTHLMRSSDITKFGRVLRKYKLDELPQLINVLAGQMSLVGPRPCLPKQFDVIQARKVLGVLKFKPGITGLAQIEKIDMSNPKLLADRDAKMMTSLCLFDYFSYLFQTLSGKGNGDIL
jgi:O-antigen biosynthesis protein WbqP